MFIDWYIPKWCVFQCGVLGVFVYGFCICVGDVGCCCCRSFDDDDWGIHQYNYWLSPTCPFVVVVYIVVNSNSSREKDNMKLEKKHKYIVYVYRPHACIVVFLLAFVAETETTQRWLLISILYLVHGNVFFFINKCNIKEKKQFALLYKEVSVWCT